MYVSTIYSWLATLIWWYQIYSYLVIELRFYNMKYIFMLYIEQK